MKNQIIIRLIATILVAVMMLLSLASCASLQGAQGPRGQQGLPGKDGVTPTIAISADGYWIINGVKTEYKAIGTDGKDGVDGEDGKDAVDGVTPTIEISSDGYWVINGTKTDVKAAGTDGKDGVDGEDGAPGKDGVDGEDGKDGITPTITISADGYWVINGVKTEYIAVACNHFWETVTTAPTCTAVGYDTLTCKLCDKRVVTNETIKIDHTYSESCTFDDNYHWFKCNDCDATNGKVMHTPDADDNCTVCGIPLSATPGVVYDVSVDGTYAEVIGYTGAATKVKIASEYNGLPVKNIYNEAFDGKRTITNIIIPDSMTSIGEYAFRGCSSLTSITIPDSVTSISYAAFSDCTSLTSITLPNYVTSICDSTFSGCTSLVSVTIGDFVTTIDYRAFWRCTSLTSVTIPDSVTSIGHQAFSGCTSLKSITIPDSVTSIGNSAFSSCSGLTSVTIGNRITSIGVNAFDNCNSQLYTEYECGNYIGDMENPYQILCELTNKNLSTYAIHENTKVIASEVFDNCGRLTNIIIPNSIISIGYHAFFDCEFLISIYFEGTVEQWDAISKDKWWNEEVAATELVCSDGTVILPGRLGPI